LFKVNNICRRGSYQWLALPAGATNSHAYFTNAAEKILHYEPVRDEQVNVIFEKPNVVKLNEML
jgi:hypothetical protein